MALLGAFAEDIRGDWSGYVSRRIKQMYEIMSQLGIHYEIDEEACCDDGRWMRDEWDGPYGTVKKIAELDRGIVDQYIDEFQYPENRFSDYNNIYKDDGFDQSLE